MIAIIPIPWARQSDFRLKALDRKAGDELHFSRLSKLRISISPTFWVWGSIPLASQRFDFALCMGLSGASRRV